MRYISVLCDFLFYNMVLFCNVMLLFVICIASTLAADTARFTPCCIGGLCGASGADDYGDVYSKPQCRRKSCVPRFVIVTDVDNALHIP